MSTDDRPITPRGTWDLIVEDWRANRHSAKARLVLAGFRLAHATYVNQGTPFPIRFAIVTAYRVATEWILGIEIPPKTEVGAGLRLYHGVGTVIHEDTIIGRAVILRHGVTLGHAKKGTGSPVVEDGVEFGAGSIVIGDVRIGAHSVVAAGAVVTADVPPGSLAVGNPAKVRES
jgi:serine acetyltransferase